MFKPVWIRRGKRTGRITLKKKRTKLREKREKSEKILLLLLAPVFKLLYSVIST